MAYAGQAPIDPNMIASIADPWVAAMQTADLERKLAGFRGPNGRIDYRQAAIALMGRHPLAAQQMLKLAEQQSSAGNRAAHLNIAQQELELRKQAENKWQVGKDEEGYEYVWRPVTGEQVYRSGPRAGQVGRLFEPGAAGTSRVPTPPPNVPRQQPGPVPSAPAGPQPAAPRPSISQSLTEVPQEDIELARSQQGTPDFEQGVNILAKQYGTTPARIRQLIGGQTENIPSDTYPGGVQHVAGQGIEISDLPPEIGQAFAQAGPPSGVTPGGFAPYPPRERPPPLDPGKPLGQNIRPINPEDRRKAEQKYYETEAKEQAEADVKAATKAADLQPYLKNIANAQAAYNKVEAAGLANRATGNPVVSNILGYGRGAVKAITGLTGKGGSGESGTFGAGIDAMDAFQRNVAQLQLLAQQAQKGLGAMSDADARRIEQATPALSSNSPEDVRAAFAEIREILVRNIRRGGMQAD